jgi:tetratricopeptide (TPR) repeat protein
LGTLLLAFAGPAAGAEVRLPSQLPAVSAPVATPGATAGSPLERLARAFRGQSADEPLADRVDRVRREASRMGMRSAESAAQGLLLAESLGDPAERAAAAVELAPGLPAAWGALAFADLGWSTFSNLARGLVELERNLAASVWWRATATRVLAWALVAGGTLFLLLGALRAVPRAGHDLSHRLPGRLPPHATGALLAAVGLLPAALGEGLVGIALGAFAIALAWSPRRERAALCTAALAVVAGLHPVTDETGRWIVALHADPATVAIRDAEVAGLSAVQHERLARLAAHDPAAAHALALFHRRSDDLVGAQHWLETVDAASSFDPVLLNQAANLRLATGDDEGAIALYEQAAAFGRRAEIWFNLAQVHGSRIELVEQQNALETAHALSASTVRELSELRGDGGLAVDLEWPVSDLRGRVGRVADVRGVAAALRAPFGRGVLVGSPPLALAVCAALVLLALALGRHARPGRPCGACGVRRCEDCPAPGPAGDDRRLCSLCGGLWPSGAGRRMAWQLLQRAVLRVVPGAAGLAIHGPWLAWIAAVAAVAAVAAFALRDGVVTDPLAAGATGRAAFLLLGGLALAAHVAATAAAFRVRR